MTQNKVRAGLVMGLAAKATLVPLYAHPKGRGAFDVSPQNFP